MFVRAKGEDMMLPWLLAEANHVFNSGSVDWGFTSFLALKEIANLQKGFLIDDTLEV